MERKTDMTSWPEPLRLLLLLAIVVGGIALYLWKSDTMGYRRFLGVMLGLALVVVGISFSLTGIGIVIGLPLIAYGLWLEYRSAFPKGA